MLLLKQTSTPPPPGSSVCDIISASELHIHRYRTVKFDSEMAVARLIVLLIVHLLLGLLTVDC